MATAAIPAAFAAAPLSVEHATVTLALPSGVGATATAGAAAGATPSAAAGTRGCLVCTRLTLCGSVVTAEGLATLRSHLAHDASRTLQHAASAAAPRAFVIVLRAAGAALTLPAEHAEAWAECMSSVEAAPLPTIFSLEGEGKGADAAAAAVGEGEGSGALNAISLELALACVARAAPPSASLSLHGWHHKPAGMVPGPRTWQLARSCGAGTLAWLLLGRGSMDASEMLHYGVLDSLDASPEGLARLVANAVGCPSAARYPHDNVGADADTTSAAASAASMSMVLAPAAQLRPASSAPSRSSNRGVAGACVDGSAVALARAGLGSASGVLASPEHGASSAASAHATALRASQQLLREVISMGEALERTRSTRSLLMRLPQIEQDSSLPLVARHLALLTPARHDHPHPLALRPGGGADAPACPPL